jgi:sulfatase maturation enzyme AslB (radical SAM superfamily)
VDEVAAHRPAAMRMGGWGEPMLHPRFVDQVRRIKRAGVRLKIYTNGILLTEDIMAALVDAGLDELQFSMQGLNQDQYEFNRRKSDYGRLAANIGMAREVRDRMGGDRPFLSLLTSALKSELEAEDPQRFLDHWTRVVDKAAVDLTNLNFVRHLDQVRDLLDDQALNMVHRRCVDVFLALEVNFNGAIEFCGQDACQTPDHVIGFVDRMSLHQAWHSDRMNAHRQAVGREVRHDQLPICRNCYHNTDKYALFKSKYSAAD